MPNYLWLDKNSDKQITISRKIAEMDNAPDKDECLEQGMLVEEFAYADWERLLEAPAFTGPKNKGNW